MQPDPWEKPDRRRVLRWRLGHQMVVCMLGGAAVGRLVPWLWLALVTLVAWSVIVTFAHVRLDRRYDRMREVDHAA